MMIKTTGKKGKEYNVETLKQVLNISKEPKALGQMCHPNEQFLSAYS